jgi:ubiquinone/menaquinone biosynthesis C-methylase UbiE
MERLTTNIYNDVMIEHLHRYGIVLDVCSGKVVLDIACGEGYGTNLIASKAEKAIGVDIDSATVEAARKKYKKDNLDYYQGSASQIPCEDNFFDVIVSFETIEHHTMHEENMSEIKRVLKPDGFFLISTPDKLVYTDKKKIKNKYHVKELYKEEFRSLLRNYFKNVELFKQQCFFGSIIYSNDKKDNRGGIKFYQGNYSYITASNEIEALYLIAIVSDNTSPIFGTSLFFDDINTFKEGVLKTSTRYQFGNLLLNPIQFFKEKFFNKS